jgi:nucleoside-diphosphate-sugar epimerase
MKILIIGGTGNISWHCVTQALQAGHEVWVLNRGETTKTRRACPPAAKKLSATMREPSSVKNVLHDMKFDVVADFICYTPDQAIIDLELFLNRTNQFIFISSTAVYDRKDCVYPISEITRQQNGTNWAYAKNKIECERVFSSHYASENFPITIVRPGHTYDTLMPDAIGNGDWTVAKRILEGKPIVVHDSGLNLWTVTHSEDFARAFIELFTPSAIGKAYHITSDEWLTWNEITETIADALNMQTNVVHMPSVLIAKLNPSFGEGLLGHKMWCDIYDNTKIRTIAKGWKARIPFKEGICRTVEWLQEDKNRQRVNLEFDAFLDGLCNK